MATARPMVYLYLQLRAQVKQILVRVFLELRWQVPVCVLIYTTDRVKVKCICKVHHVDQSAVQLDHNKILNQIKKKTETKH